MIQSPKVKEIVRALQRRGDCAAGLTSMGPLVYAVSDGDNRYFGKFADLVCHRVGARLLGAFSGRNRGYKSS